MAIEFTDWCNQNEQSAYPVSTNASKLNAAGELLREDVVCDAKIWFPRALGLYAAISAVTVTQGIVSVSIIGLDYQPGETPTGNIVSLGAVTVVKPINLYRNYPIQPILPGVGGWIMFGRGAEDTLYDWRAADPAAGFLEAKACRSYMDLPFQGVKSSSESETVLTGLVQLSGINGLIVEQETRNINGEDKLCLVFKTDPNMSLEDARILIGECAGLAEQGACDPPVLRTINNVGPDANGNINLESTVGMDGEFRTYLSSLLIDSFISLSDHCDNRRRLPDTCGNLPDPVYDPCTPGRWDWCTSEVPK